MKWNFELASRKGGRKVQQDRIEVFTSMDQSECLAVLADGLGGHSNGEIAAQKVIDIAKERFEDRDNSEPEQFLYDLCFDCHELILQMDDNDKVYPATTCVILLLFKHKAYWIHVGDSRLYQFSGDEIEYVTRDHSISELEIEKSSELGINSGNLGNSSKLYMCLGGKNKLKPDYGSCEVKSDTWFVLCSDGITNPLGTKDIIAKSHNSESFKESASIIAEMAVLRGGSFADNASIIIARPEALDTTSSFKGLIKKWIKD